MLHANASYSNEIERSASETLSKSLSVETTHTRKLKCPVDKEGRMARLYVFGLKLSSPDYPDLEI